MSDTTARAREPLKDFIAKVKAYRVNRGWAEGAELDAALVEIEQLAAQSASVEEVAREIQPCLKDLARRPRMGSAVIIRDELGRVLVGQRCKDPFRGYWVIPGGGIWPNETINAAAMREIKEETGLDIEITGRLGIFEDINETFHIILVMSFGRVIGGELKPGDDCGELRWVGQDEFVTLETTPINKQVFKILRHHGYGAQGQGVGPRCPKCGKTRPCLMRINATKTEYVGLVRCYACGSDIHLNNIEDFAQFFSPVPSPESATKEEK